MKPLAAFFCPPLYFLLQGKKSAATIHLVFWILSIITLVVGIGVLIWLVQVSMATWDLRNQHIEDQATAIATKMAAAMKQGEANS